jgi:hypothetical protein
MRLETGDWKLETGDWRLLVSNLPISSLIKESDFYTLMKCADGDGG